MKRTLTCLTLALLAVVSTLTFAQQPPLPGSGLGGPSMMRGRGVANPRMQRVVRSAAGPGAVYDNGPRLANSSWTYVEQIGPRRFAKYDIVFIAVSETSQSTAEADVQRRKNAIYDAVLEEWVQFRDFFTLKPATQRDGDPAIKGQLNQTYRVEGDTEQRESIQLKVAARVADIQPNGHLVLEAHKWIRVNNEVFEVSLSGVVDPEDIASDRSVRSERIVNLRLERKNSGHVRDATRRGWLTRLIDEFNPF